MAIKYSDYTNWCRSNLGFNDTCRACKLAHSDQSKDPPVAGGTSAKSFEDLKLIVISDHPGFYEVKYQYPMYDNKPERDKKDLLRPNAGAYIRGIIESWKVNNQYLNSYEDVYFTNAIKCNPGQKTVEKLHITQCSKVWLNLELLNIDKVNPTVPILVAGATAFKAMIPYLEETDKGTNSKNNINKYRRRVLSYKRHPVVVTFNPASVASSIPRIETSKNLDYVISLPSLPVSPESIFYLDLQPLKELLENNAMDF